MTNKKTIEIEDYYGNRLMAFEINLSTGKIERTESCSYADSDGDYIFDSDNELIRVQSDNIIDRLGV